MTSVDCSEPALYTSKRNSARMVSKCDSQVITVTLCYSTVLSGDIFQNVFQWICSTSIEGSVAEIWSLYVRNRLQNLYSRLHRRIVCLSGSWLPVTEPWTFLEINFNQVFPYYQFNILAGFDVPNFYTRRENSQNRIISSGIWSNSLLGCQSRLPACSACPFGMVQYMFWVDHC